MPDGVTYLPYSDTGYFSRLVTDYLGKAPALEEFYNYYPDQEGLAAAIEQRSKFPINREVLADTLTRQYEQLTKHPAVEQNIALLRNENTFSVCTAHQPNLLTGYLYFIYKIVHAIKLAEELKQMQPDKNFVPVYYIGSEDNDLDELGTFRYGDRKFVWDAAGQTGAVGRMSTESLKPILDELFKLLGPPGENCDELKDLLSRAYLQHKTIAKATQYLVNELFGRFGLIALDPDEAAFKKEILPVLQDELLNQNAYSIVSAQAEKLDAHYKVQAHPRAINLFYLNEQLRERIEQKGDRWYVLSTEISWDKDELLAELKEHPERFSPNVILRGIFQESILPNVAFIGGGAEVAYWMQLKPVFEYYKVFYPAIVLRQSVQWIGPVQSKLIQQLQFSIKDVFKPEVELIKEYISRNSTDKWQTGEEDAAMEKILAQLKQKATSVDPTLGRATEAVLTRIKYQLQVLEKKMLRAEKRKMQTQVLKINRLKNILFPNNGLQERVDNFMPYYLQYGNQYFDILKDAMLPMEAQFLVLEK